MKPSPLPLIVVLVVAAACAGGGTEPRYGRRKGVAVSITGAAPTFSVGVSDSGYPRANCTVSLTAQATGDGAATWGSATFYFHVGLDRSKLQDSAVVTAADVAQSWARDTISSAEQEHGGWVLSDGLPFDVDIVFHYSMPSSTAGDTARVHFTCGPAPTGTIAPPAVSQLALTPQRAQWQPGDSLGVQFQASSATGLWLTYTAISGAFSADTFFRESLQLTDQKLDPVHIPASAALGQPVVATAYAVDGFGQYVSQSVASTALVDVTRPTVLVNFWTPPYRTFSTTIGGIYFVGDSIDFNAWAGDNHALSAFVWHATPGNYGDSVVANGATYVNLYNLLVPMHAAWSDSVQFHFYAYDLSGNVSDTLTTPAHAFTVYPTLTRPTVTATVNGDIDATLVDTARAVVYVLQSNQRRIAVLSLDSLRQTGTIALPGFAQSFDMTPGGDSLVVPLGGDLVVIDLRQPAAPTLLPLTGVDTASHQYAAQVRIASNDHAFVVLSGDTVTQAVLLDVNLATGAQRLRTDAGPGVLGVGRSLDQRVLMVARGCIERYVAATDAFGPCTAMGNSAMPSSDRSGEHFAIQLTAFDSSLAPMRTVQSLWPLGSSWLPTSISADAAYLYYFFAQEGVIRARVSDGAVLDRTPLGFDAFSMQISPDGADMLLADDEPVTLQSRLAVIDLRDADAKLLQSSRLPRGVPVLTPSRVRTPSVRSPALAPAPTKHALPWKHPPSAPRPYHASR